MAQLGHFSNQTGCDVIYQLCLTSSFFSITFPLSPKTIQQMFTYQYLPWYIHRNCRDRSYWNVVQRTGLLMTYSLSKLLKAFYWPFKLHTIFKNICSEAWPPSATLLSNSALKWWPCWVRFVTITNTICSSFSPPVPPIFSEKCDTILLTNAFFSNFLEKNQHKPQNRCVTIFSSCRK